MTMRMILLIVCIFLIVKTHQQTTTDWIDYDLSSDIDSDLFPQPYTRDDEEELEVFSPILTGFKYISGGAGEGRQHLSPNGEFPNHQEIKTDEELPLFCHPPNPCPLEVEADDCDSSPMSLFSAEYSRWYQNQQLCSCDADHDQCSSSSIQSKNVLQRSRRNRNGFSSNHQVKINPVISDQQSSEDFLW